MPAIIKVKKLRKSFKKVKKDPEASIGKKFLNLIRPQFINVDAVKNISFEIFQGESVAFLGPNGAGKTTTIKMLTGLIFPTSGDISVLKFKPSDRKRDYLMNIGLVMGNKAGLNWDLTPKQSFELFKVIYKIPDAEFKKTVEELTELLDTKKFLDTQVRRLSLGERMKMELIGAILHKPKILFLDEPTVGLDIISKQKIREFLRKIQQEYKVTLLLTSHDMDDIEKVCDRVIVINKGEKVYDDHLVTLTNKYNKTKYIKFYFDEVPSISTDAELLEKTENSLTYKIDREKLSKFIGEVTSKYRPLDIDIVSIPLEEIIADIFRR